MNKKLNKKIKECYNYESEHGHTEADNILCELLLKLGYKDIVEVFNDLDKWYS